MPEQDQSGAPGTTEQWWATVAAELDLGEIAAADRIDVVLDLARGVAHAVARPSAPLTAFLIGAAVGRGIPMDEAVRRVQSLLARW
ncbi:MAG: DUF6457 domain-containing protein [Jatrophihabitans sp.]